MIDFSPFEGAISLLYADIHVWLVIVPGLLLGLVFGAIPGLSISICMAIFLPITLYMDFVPAILFLTAIFTGGGFGCAIPAILMNIPGTSASVATTFDGYPMAKRGDHNKALGIALASSVFGAGLSYAILLIFIGAISNFVLKLGPTEMFIVALWGISLIAVLQDNFFLRGLLAGVFGLSLGMIGISNLGVLRGTFGSVYLFDGIPAIPALIGMFAASELFNLIRNDYLVVDEEKRIVAPFNKSTNFEFLSFTAKQRGLPIIYPKSYDRDLLRTIEIDGTLGPSDHLRGVAELIASKYQLASILLAHIRKINFDIWQINWFLRVDDKSFSGTFVDGFLPLSLSELLDQAVDKIAVNLVRSPMDDLKENVKVLVDKVVDLDDYMGLIEFLEKLDVVEKVVVNSIDETQVMLTVTARRGEKNLKQSIEFGNYIRKVSDNPLTYDYQ